MIEARRRADALSQLPNGLADRLRDTATTEARCPASAARILPRWYGGEPRSTIGSPSGQTDWRIARPAIAIDRRLELIRPPQGAAVMTTDRAVRRAGP